MDDSEREPMVIGGAVASDAAVSEMIDYAASWLKSKTGFDITVIAVAVEGVDEEGDEVVVACNALVSSTATHHEIIVDATDALLRLGQEVLRKHSCTHAYPVDAHRYQW